MDAPVRFVVVDGAACWLVDGVWFTCPIRVDGTPAWEHADEMDLGDVAYWELVLNARWG